jgi:hypothetical protein
MRKFAHILAELKQALEMVMPIARRVAEMNGARV